WRLLVRQLRTPTIIGVALLAFVGYWTTTLRVSWLPLYLEQGLGYDAVTAGRLVTAPYAVAAAAAVAAGYASNRMIAPGESPSGPLTAAAAGYGQGPGFSATVIVGGGLLSVLLSGSERALARLSGDGEAVPACGSRASGSVSSASAGSSPCRRSGPRPPVWAP